MTNDEYWEECIAQSAEECGLFMQNDQLTAIAKAVRFAHEMHSTAFYSPPASDRINALENEWKQKYAKLQREFDQYRENAEKAVKRVTKQYRDANVSIEDDGEIIRHDGLSETIL